MVTKVTVTSISSKMAERCDCKQVLELLFD